MALRDPLRTELVLDVLLAADLTPERLAWCFEAMRHDDPALVRSIQDRLSAIRSIPGTTAFLDALEAGLRHPASAAAALDLLHGVTWSGLQMFVTCMRWLSAEAAQLRHLAAIFLARHHHLGVPFLMLQEAARARAQDVTTGLDLSWAAFERDSSLLRLVCGLWTRGWHDALTQLWFNRGGRLYVALSSDWLTAGEFTADEGTVALVASLLHGAQYGQGLIPLFRLAAAELTELEAGNTADAPAPSAPDHLEAVQRDLRERIDAAAAGEAEEPMLVSDAALLSALLRRDVPVGPSAARLLGAIHHGDDRTWYWACCRLAGMPGQEAAASHALGEALASADPGRRQAALCLATLLVEPHRHEIAALAAGMAVPGAPLLSLCLDTAVAADRPPSRWPLPEITVPALLRPFVPGADSADGLPMAEIASLLTSPDLRTRAASAFLLMTADLAAYVVPVLIEAALSSDDRLRWKAYTTLEVFCSQLPTDGSTVAVDLFQHDRQERLSGVAHTIEGTGFEASFQASGQAAIAHDSMYWIDRWLGLVERGDDNDRRWAQAALGTVGRVSAAVAEAVSQRLRTAASHHVREGAGHVIAQVLHDSDLGALNVPTLAVVIAALVAALEDRDPRVRSIATYALQWIDIQRLSDPWLVLRPLTALARSDPDPNVQVLALRSLGRMACGTEWKHDVIAAIEPLLLATEPAVSRAAAAGVVAAVQDQDDCLAACGRYLSDPGAMLTALVEAAADSASWQEAAATTDGAPRRPNAAAVERIAEWIQGQAEPLRARLVEQLVTDLDRWTDGMENLSAAQYDVIGEPDWAARRVIAAVLAHLSDRLTFRSLFPQRGDEVLDLLARVARDPSSYNARRFALAALGNLQHFTSAVATAVFEACRDLPVVYREARVAATKFRHFLPGSLATLTSALDHATDSVTEASRAAEILGELGVTRSEELGAWGRSDIANALARAIRRPLGRLDVHELEPSEREIRRIGTVDEVLYQALLRVVAGPDAPEHRQDIAEQVVWQYEPGDGTPELDDIIAGFERLVRKPAESSAVEAAQWRLVEQRQNCFISFPCQENWVKGISHHVQDGYLQLVVQPNGHEMEFRESEVVVGSGSVPPSTAPPASSTAASRSADSLVIAVPKNLADSPSYAYRDGYLHLILRSLDESRALTGADVVVVRQNSLNISFPYWDGAIERAEYTLVEGSLNVFAIPGAEGLKHENDTIVISRGPQLPSMDEAAMQTIRERTGRPNVRQIVSFPFDETNLSAVSYRVAGNYLHVIIEPSRDSLTFDRRRVRLQVVPDHEAVVGLQAGGAEWRAIGERRNVFISFPCRETWVRRISHQAVDGYVRLVIEPNGHELQFRESQLIVTTGSEAPGRRAILSDRPKSDEAVSASQPPETEEPSRSSDDLVISVPQHLADSPSYAYRDGYLHLILRPPNDSATVTAGDVIVARQNNLNISFPFWDNAIDRATYTLEGSVLRIVVVPGDDGLKYTEDDVVVSRGASLPSLSDRRLAGVRAREPQDNVRELVATVPITEGGLGRVTHRISGNYIHIVVEPSGDSLAVDGHAMRLHVLADREPVSQLEGTDAGWEEPTNRRSFFLSFPCEPSWVKSVTHRLAGGQLQVVVEPDGQDLVFRESQLRVGTEPEPVGAADTPDPDDVEPDGDEIPSRGADNLVIAAPQHLVSSPAYSYRDGRLYLILHPSDEDAVLSAGDVVVARQNSLNISFPHWADAVDNATYRLGDGVIEIVLTPGPDGVRYGEAAIGFSRGTMLPSIDQAAIEAIRAREPQANVRELIVSVPLSEENLGRVSSHVSGNCLHVIIEPTTRSLPFRRHQVRIRAVPERDPQLDVRNTLNISFPHWEGSVEKVSYTMEGEWLNVILVPGEEGLRYDGEAVVLSRGSALPSLDESALQATRDQPPIEGAHQLVVSLPLAQESLGGVSYEIVDNYLHIIIEPGAQAAVFDLSRARMAVE